jgi:carboxymethylenebutenolidase
MAETSGTMVEFQANGATAHGYLARPPEGGSHPGVIVVQEWWGVDRHIRDLAERFAREGFVALAPDLYGGRVTTEPDEARKLAMTLDLPRAVKEMVGAVNYLYGLPGVGKIGVIGFCMGGSLALLLASKTPRVAGAVSFYGGRALDDADVRQIGSPVLAIYGGKDGGIPPDRIEHFRDQWTRAAIDHEIVVYPDADHAFFNDTRPQVYNPTAAADAWDRTIRFFRSHLQ